jgi:hypothetical protein
MKDHIEDLLERFMHEFPYGDTRELATFMYNMGVEETKEKMGE